MIFPALCLALIGMAGYLATIDIGQAAQTWLGACLVGTLFVFKPFDRTPFIRMTAIAIATFTSFRYFWWRATETLPTSSWIVMALGIILILAELYGLWISSSSSFITLRPINRKSAPLPSDNTRWPTVDILVPSYDEPWEVVGTTLLAARAVRWPQGKMRVVLCDDGGTKAAREQHDPVKAEAALKRHIEFKQKCEEIGVLYLTREANVGAKAGNLNHALRTLSAAAELGGAGQLVAIFDADHAPTSDFLERTVGIFLEDEKCFLVQTPHFFVTPDPIEKNLGTFRMMPGESDLFYFSGQPGLDFWNASFFCGSAAVLRRKALDEVGGICENTVTEDAHTSLEIAAKGWNSAYLPRPMVAGLQPASYASFVKQRIRWTQGMIQIFLLHNPLLKRGLTIPQRLCYGANSGFWFFPFARVVFLLSPIPYLIFGLQIFNATTAQFLSYAMPHLACSVLLTDMLNGRWRWPFVSELYELALSLYTMPAVFGTILNPKKPTFTVTAKDEHIEKDILSPLAKPFIGFLSLLVFAFGVGVWRAFVNPRDLDAITIVLGWDLFNIMLLMGAIGAMYEMRHRRGTPRVPKDMPATLTVNETFISARILDASVGGAGVKFDASSIALQQGDIVGLTFAGPDGNQVQTICEVRHRRDDSAYGLQFINPTVEARLAIVGLVYGSSDAWVAENERRTQRKGLLAGMVFFFRIALGRGPRALGRSFFAGA